MLKRISVADLRIGMFVQELCGSWLEHPFWRKSFKLSNPRDLKSMQDSSVREVWIDTDKGLDVANGNSTAIEQNDVDIDKTLQSLEATSAKPNTIARVSTIEERARATKILTRSKEAVASMFQEARMGKALDANDALPLVEEITASVSRNPGALISLARLKNKDDYTYMHSVATCGLMVVLARELKLSDEDVRQAGMAGLLHDVGKMMIPSKVLNKPGKLTDDEFLVVKNHPTAGYELLLEGKGVSEAALDVCLHHHEKVDGSGYPHKLSGDQISQFAKMGAVCDVYDAITSNRPYKVGWSPAESLRKMAEWSKGHFDPVIFQAFVKSVGIYPVGSLVGMESGRLGIVIDQSEKSLLSPIVKTFYSTKSQMRIPTEIIDLSKNNARDKITSHENPAKWGLHNLDDVWVSGSN